MGDTVFEQDFIKAAISERSNPFEKSNNSFTQLPLFNEKTLMDGFEPLLLSN